MVSHHTKAIKSVEEKFGDRFSYLSDDHLNNVKFTTVLKVILE